MPDACERPQDRSCREYSLTGCFLSCSPQTGTATIANQPVVVFEILSPGTSRLDRIAKAREYDNTPFVQRYAIPEQTSQAATVLPE